DVPRVDAVAGNLRSRAEFQHAIVVDQGCGPRAIAVEGNVRHAVDAVSHDHVIADFRVASDVEAFDSSLDCAGKRARDQPTDAVALDDAARVDESANAGRGGLTDLIGHHVADGVV